jgi:signal transduction histidine kinase/ActR/RegA family two-component response regulator
VQADAGATASSDPSLVRLLGFARKLQNITTFGELLEISREEVRATTGYSNAWLFVQENPDEPKVRCLEFSGAQRENVWELAPVLDASGDPFLRDILASRVPIVIEDARLDPRTNKTIVEQLQNRTLINVPMMLLDAPFGVFGVGTFGEEGCRLPRPEELDYLAGMASQISVAASRIRWLDGRARAAQERISFERRMAQVQKLESLGLLAGGIAHDFNNLLTVIIASGRLAEAQIEHAGARAEVQQVLEAAERACSLTRQLLAMSRAQGLSLRPIDLNELLRKLVQMMRRVLPENILVELIECRSLPQIEGDASQIEQVFMNLLINARDAMPNGGQLTLETEQVLVNGHYAETHPWAKAGRYVLATVTDNGSGMTREVQEHIFEPFFTTKGPKAGTGLGLAVSYGIVRQHEGMFHCYSELGVGSSFKVYLPVASRLASSVGNKLKAAVPRGNGHILIAEDDAAVRAVAMRILERGGYHVKGTGSADEACIALAAQPFDLILMDVVMPGMSCQDAVQRMRQLCPSAVILLSSGYTAGTSVLELVAQTGLQLLEKPYDPDELLSAVSALLERSAVRSPASSSDSPKES